MSDDDGLLGIDALGGLNRNDAVEKGPPIGE
jgi:hypothetical protein